MVTDFELLNMDHQGAEFSPCRRYRYSLWRVWEPKKRRVAFIGVNPSTADEKTNDATIIRCINFAKAWGYGGLWMINLFAYRATKPKEMKLASDPVGGENDGYLIDVGRSAQLVVLAWGVHGAHRGRGREVIALLRWTEIPFMCLGVTKGGHPKHPLMLRKDTRPMDVPWCAQ
jgi:hypothetical protein